MKKRILLLGVICFFILFALTGCGNKTVISTGDFKSKATNLGYETTNVKKQFAFYDYIKEAIVATNSKGYQVEFYVLESKEEAKNMFNTNKTIFESYKVNISKESTTNIANYSNYTLVSGGYYMYICRVDNTMFYARVKETFKDDVKTLVQELGY